MGTDEEELLKVIDGIPETGPLSFVAFHLSSHDPLPLQPRLLKVQQQRQA
jgi:hypothetical protein